MLTRSTKELAYNSLLRPTMEYAAAVWYPYYGNQIHDIEMVQRRAACYCLHAYGHESVTAMIQQLKWETLEQRRLKARVVMGYRVNDLIKIPKDQLIPNKSISRGHHIKYHTTYAKMNYYKYTFFPTVIPLWNSLPVSAISAATIDIFKDKLAAVTNELLRKTICLVYVFIYFLMQNCMHLVLHVLGRMKLNSS